MTGAETLPLWIAVPVALMLVIGSSLALAGTIGLFRLRSFYDRLHSPALGASGGTGGVILSSVLLFSALGSRPILHEVVIALFMLISMPVTIILLGRAAVHRSRAGVPPDLPPIHRAPPD